jgi:hypothetical protein
MTPRVTEVSLPRARAGSERDDFADETPSRRPRMAPYRRSSQRELVRMAVALELHPDVYPDRRIKA